MKFKATHVGNFKGIQSKVIMDANVLVDTFDPRSDNYDASIYCMQRMIDSGQLFAMPMHGWFEVQCNITKINRDRGVLPGIFKAGSKMPIEFIHIDHSFLVNYGDVDIPFIKSKDHIYLVIAKKRVLPLVTWDKQMTVLGRSCGIIVYNPIEWMAITK